MAGMVASTTSDLRELTLVAVPGWVQIPGVILIGLLCGLALRSAVASVVVLVVMAIFGALLQGAAIALAGLEIDEVAVTLINRGTVQGFFALLVIFCFGMVGIVASMMVNVFARRRDI